MAHAGVPIHVRVEINGRGTAFRDTVPASEAAERTVQLVAKACTEAWGADAISREDQA